MKYRADKPIAELLDMLQKDVAACDTDVRAKFQQYNQTKTALAQLQRAATGNLAQKSLSTVVNPDNILKPDDSEYLQQHLVAVPNTLVKDFLKTYETLSPMVVPRSGQLLAKDDEYQLWAVTVFKKHSGEFVHKCREHRWTPRELKFHEGGRAGEEEELRGLEREERRVWGEALRLGRTGYSDAVMCWVHVLCLRVFVETVLRYGLPLSYVCGLVKVSHARRRRGPGARMHADARRRRTRNAARRRSSPSTRDSGTWAARRWRKTRRAGRRRTTRRRSRRWRARGSGKTKGTSRTSSTSSRSHSRAARWLDAGRAGRTKGACAWLAFSWHLLG